MITWRFPAAPSDPRAFCLEFRLHNRVFERGHRNGGSSAFHSAGAADHAKWGKVAHPGKRRAKRRAPPSFFSAVRCAPSRYRGPAARRRTGGAFSVGGRRKRVMRSRAGAGRFKNRSDARLKRDLIRRRLIERDCDTGAGFPRCVETGGAPQTSPPPPPPPL